ncbi:hypothetical protein GC173_02525 [bacterium]|nr:hypothetical protein [bacterium]
MGTQVLLFEGNDDLHVVSNLCQRRRVPPIETVKDCKGIDPLLRILPGHLKGSDGDVVGIVVDADTSVQRCWEKVRKILMEKGYPNVPYSADPLGTIIQAEPSLLLPRFGAWLMPDNRSAGALEDFILPLVPTDSWLYSYATSSVDAIPAAERLFADGARRKALLHTWLAWQEVPGVPYGKAIGHGYIRSDSPVADQLVQWVQRLFQSPPIH